jgi:glyoxylase-like metal-dependent hydrolase (beta-lactamase superfamily II)
MTLEGTNTYVLGDPAHGAAVVVDPGPDLPAHRSAVEGALAGRDVAAVVITHHHADHAEAAGWAAAWGAPLRAFDPALVPGAAPYRDGEVVAAAGLHLEAVHTPGHASDHLCLRVRGQVGPRVHHDGGPVGGVAQHVGVGALEGHRRGVGREDARGHLVQGGDRAGLAHRPTR